MKIKIILNEDEKTNPKKYFDKLNEDNAFFLKVVKKYRVKDVIKGEIYTNQILDIIKKYNITESIIVRSIRRIGKRQTIIEEFNEIPDPLKLEFFIAIFLALKYQNKFAIKPNYKADHLGKPYSHAPGNKGDIELYSLGKKEIFWLIEVTLIRNKTQQLNFETTSVLRHFQESKEYSKYLKKYLSFVAPAVHPDTRVFYEFSIFQTRREGKVSIFIRPYSINEFIEVTVKKGNFISMENYTKEVLAKLIN